MSLKNCPRCGRLYMPGIKDVCPNCLKEIDNEYDLCSKYLREHRGASMQELHEETGVSIKQITKFIREGRISIVHMPNFSIPCDSCGEPIKQGNLCGSCRQKLTQAVSNMTEDERRAKELQEQRLQMKFNINDRLNRDRK